MDSALVRPLGRFDPAEALRIAQQAPAILKNNPKAFSTSPFVSLFTAAETPEIWIVYENLLISCLRTGDDDSARECLERLTIRFGETNPHIMALKGLVKEATAADDAALQRVLKEYNAILAEDDANIAIAKRRVVVLVELNRPKEAIAALVALLDMSPTDGEAWVELADLYAQHGLWTQAIYSLEEVIVLAPNAWNMHARLAEVLFMAAKASPDSDNSYRWLAESVKRYCRSIELCESYLRGFYGLKLLTDRLLSTPVKVPKKMDADDFKLPPQATLEKLNELATKKLAEIVRRNSAKDPEWRGYDPAEVEAARRLLDESAAKVAK